MNGTTTITELADAQREAAQRVDALDLDPVVFKLMHPEPGEQVMTLAEADELIGAYRCFLKLCAWYPGESIVPTRAVDEAWHAHILDTAKYAEDSQAVFGFFLDHFPYLGLRGPDDEATWQAAAARTRDLFRSHFGTALNGLAGDCDEGGLCVPEGEKCDKRPGGALEQPRPRPDRSAAGMPAARSCAGNCDADNGSCSPPPRGRPAAS
jgi:hypothetical protein